MITMLILVCLVVVTYLITDFRRYLEVEDLKLSYECKANDLSRRAYDAGIKYGAQHENSKNDVRFVYHR